jgi:hypothetical protein
MAFSDYTYELGCVNKASRKQELECEISAETPGTSD